MIAVVAEYEDAELQQHTAPEMHFELEPDAMRRRLISNNEGILRPGALHKIRTLQVLEIVPLGNALSDRALKEVPGVEHIPILYTNETHNSWRARYRELADGEAERLSKDFARYVPPRYIELGPTADAVSLYHEAVHARRAHLGRSMLPEHAEPSAVRAEQFAARLERQSSNSIPLISIQDDFH